MKLLKYAGLAILVLGIGAVGLVVVQPSTAHIERSKVIEASVADIQPQITDLNKWLTWNPWSAMDPSMKTTVSDPPAGKGAWYTWEGEKAGSGRLTIQDIVDGHQVVETLEFTAPMQTKAAVSFTFAPEGENTKVVWAYDETGIGFVRKAFGLVMDLDAMLGGDFEKGLESLATVAVQAKTARLEAEKAAAEAAAAAVAVPPAP